MTESDKDLLQMAAKAAGYRVARVADDGVALLIEGIQESWDPLADDGDALRLAVRIGISPGRCFQVVIDSDIQRTGVRHTDRGGKYDSLQEHTADTYAATRRAIVRAAAEIGRGME